jgi:hypothetical protein
MMKGEEMKKRAVSTGSIAIFAALFMCDSVKVYEFLPSTRPGNLYHYYKYEARWPWELDQVSFMISRSMKCCMGFAKPPEASITPTLPLSC